MNAVNSFMQIISSVFNTIFKLKVPGFDFTFWQLIAGIVLVSFGISLLRFLFGLPIGSVQNLARSDANKALKNRVHPKASNSGSH